MTRTCLLTVTIVMLLMHSQVFAQSQDSQKFEVAAEFTTLERDDFSGGRTEPGFGGDLLSIYIACSVWKRRATFFQSDVLVAPKAVA